MQSKLIKKNDWPRSEDHCILYWHKTRRESLVYYTLCRYIRRWEKVELYIQDEFQTSLPKWGKNSENHWGTKIVKYNNIILDIVIHITNHKKMHETGRRANTAYKTHHSTDLMGRGK